MKRYFIIMLIFWINYLNYINIAYGSIFLNGQHKFSPGDNLRWASVEYDDSHWQLIKVPASWQSQRVKSKHGMGWYRIYVFIPTDFKQSIQPALFLGRIGDADEVFFNGIKIGSEGIVGDNFVEATLVERLYKIPKNIVKFGQENLIAIRIMNTYLRGGILGKKVILGEYKDLLFEKLFQEATEKNLELCFLTFLSLYCLFCILLYLKGIKGREYITFGCFVFILELYYLFDSLIFYQTGLKTHIIQKLIFGLITLLPITLILFVTSVFKEPLNKPLKATILFLLFVFLCSFFSSSYTVYLMVFFLWIIAAFFSGLFILFKAIKAYKNRLDDSGPILLGVVSLCLGGLLEIAGFFSLIPFFYAGKFSLFIFMLCIMYGLIARYARVTQSLKNLSGKILDAQEEERRRLSRDLHDGIAQSLLAIKLNLQMIKAQTQKGILTEPGIFSELISEVSHSITELRNIAMALRPSFIEDTELSEIFKWYSKKFQKRTGISISIKTTGPIQASITVKDNLFRVYQEALTNVLKHAKASSVDVFLQKKGRIIYLKIDDNGQGFPLKSYTGDKGIGLSTIKERIELLGGVFRIKSIPGRGTSLWIEVPIK